MRRYPYRSDAEFRALKASDFYPRYEFTCAVCGSGSTAPFEVTGTSFRCLECYESGRH